MRVKLLSNDAKIPIKGSPRSAGVDLFAKTRVVVPGIIIRNGNVNVGRALIPTGVAAAIPVGLVGKICSRSGLSIQHNIEVGAGWIDSDYRGEIYVELKNFSSKNFHIKPGMRIAQLILLKISHVAIQVVKSLPPSRRGKHGLGSTGLY